MSTDTAKRLAQAEADRDAFRARLKVLEKQRNDALNQAMIAEATANLERDALVRQANAEIKRLTAELEKATKPAEASAPPEAPAPKAHANGEACPAA